MKKKIFSIVAMVLGAIVFTHTSCTKYDENPNPDSFDVSTSKLTYKVGDECHVQFQWSSR